MDNPQLSALQAVAFALILAAAGNSGCPARVVSMNASGSETWSSSAIQVHDESGLIEPGVKVGPLKLDDTRARALQLFPKKPNVDQETFLPNCGTEYVWVDLEGSPAGTIVIRFKQDRVWQIESEAPKYHLQDGIKSGDLPDRIRRDFRGLRAFEFIGPTPEVFGERHLIFWTEEAKGLAFALVYSRARKRRYLFSIVVYHPNTEFCPEGEEMSPENWRELPPYSLEPVNETTTSGANRGLNPLR